MYQSLDTFRFETPSADHLTRPLPSSPITRPSSLLQGDPPELPASVLSPRGFGRLCFSLHIRKLVPAVPHKSLCPTRAPIRRPPSQQALRGLISGEKKTPLILTTLDTLTTRHRGVCFSSPLSARAFGLDDERYSIGNMWMQGFMPRADICVAALQRAPVTWPPRPWQHYYRHGTATHLTRLSPRWRNKPGRRSVYQAVGRASPQLTPYLKVCEFRSLVPVKDLS
jgi:hypothetical protein